MTLCPVAIVAGCKNCPVVKICPAKGIIGDYRKPADAKPEQPAGDPSKGSR